MKIHREGNTVTFKDGEYVDTFRVSEAGTITDPGKFEGEMYYIPYYWNVYMNGCADRDDGRILGFDITAEDKTLFPELKRRRTVKLYQRDDGFICEV